MTKPAIAGRRQAAAWACALGAAFLASCTPSVPLAPVPAPAPAPVAAPPASAPPMVATVPASPVVQPPAAAASPETVQSGATEISSHRSSAATTPRAYRSDAATHLYGLNRDRIYKGRMPPLLYAIGVLQVEVDGKGNVHQLSWMRAPNHAPEVIREIERTVRAAAPFPAPARMGRVVYTDTWLWHKSGRFQLDTLTEGQD